MQDLETILVVDDEANIRTILRYLLQQEGFEVVTANDGQEALDILEELTPDLVILDVMMPHVDGLQVLTEMRSRFATNNIPVMLLTAKGDLPHKVQGLREGANDYLVKPFEHEELILRVRNILQFSRNQRDANPLTGLPGNRAIEMELQRRLDKSEPFGFLYVDLDKFKSFNDHYGYSRGDKLLSLLADCLHRAADEIEENVFLGHIGGDDFVAITAAGDALKVAHSLVKDFDARKRLLYDPEDWARGWVETKGRTGKVLRTGPVSVTVATVIDHNGTMEHIGRVNEAAVELKQFGKNQTGSIVVEERRKESETDVTVGIVSVLGD